MGNSGSGHKRSGMLDLRADSPSALMEFHRGWSWVTLVLVSGVETALSVALTLPKMAVVVGREASVKPAALIRAGTTAKPLEGPVKKSPGEGPRGMSSEKIGIPGHQGEEAASQSSKRESTSAG